MKCGNLKKQVPGCLWIGLFVLVTHGIHACSCIDPQKFTIEDYTDYDVILKGTVISAEHVPDTVFKYLLGEKEVLMPFGGYYEIGVKVDVAYKSKPDSIFVFKTSASNGMNCAITFEKGEEWYIFANGRGDSYWVGGCSWSSRTKYNSKRMKQALRYVEKMARTKQKQIRESYWAKRIQEHRTYVTGTLIGGKAEGKWTYSYHKGSSYLEGNFVNGLKEGLWLYHFTTRDWSTGPLKYKFYYQDGVKQALVEYDRNGKVVYGWVLKGYEIPRTLFTDEEIRQMLQNQY